MMSAADSLPDDIESLKLLLRERDAELAQARATASNATALIAHLQLSIDKLRRELYGVRSERKAPLLEQMELEAEGAEDDLAAEREAETAKLTTVRSFSRKKPSRQPFPAHLPR
ncbi:MAG TPA: transposase, partial [Rhizomicrobium sp.]|nr:transposase [Rhizomicrobium sp.]